MLVGSPSLFLPKTYSTQILFSIVDSTQLKHVEIVIMRKYYEAPTC